MMDGENKQRLRGLMRNANLDTLAVKKLLEQQTKRKYSIRTVQAWAADSSKASSRECPEWVLENLEQIIKEL
ncbi:MAG TPA: hypothetical protein PKL69_07650 [Agitococcus sp.]|nr:hypothetical protein [Agitococcus sp.]HMY29274.1 hypothetical protein [Agitococcus sp.]HNB20169.1 hypothetical protein [Agitococcus sp.]HNH45363.1 hypothetical protein [Agitococcus sp.]HNI63566.1 hypothetical protein [Agitococcus sp.]